MIPIISQDPDVQTRFARMVLAGESVRMAEILATRKFPGTRTDTEFNKGRCNGNQFEATPARGDWYRAEAERHGVSTTGKFYHDGLADFPGDPTAWVSGRGDVLAVARAKGLRLTGSVDYEPPDFRQGPPPVSIPIDPAIVDAEVSDIMDENPHLCREDVHEKIYGLRAGLVDNNPLRVQESNPDDELVDFN